MVQSTEFLLKVGYKMMSIIIKEVQLKRFERPFVIKAIPYSQFYKIYKKHCGFLPSILVTNDSLQNVMNEFLFTCLVYPKFESVSEMLQTLLPGEYAELCKQVQSINGYEI
jgi:hypothetical protein